MFDPRALDGGRAHQPDHRMFGGGVGRHVRHRAQPCGRGGQHQRAAAPPLQMRHQRLEAEPDAARIDGHDAVEHFDRIVADGRERAFYAGIQQADVDAAEPFDRGRRNRLVRRRVRHIAFMPGRAGLAGQRLEPVRVQIDQHQRRALGREQPRGRRADAAGRPRNHRYLARKPCHAPPSPAPFYPPPRSGDGAGSWTAPSYSTSPSAPGRKTTPARFQPAAIRRARTVQPR